MSFATSRHGALGNNVGYREFGFECHAAGFWNGLPKRRQAASRCS
ncbi:hypothetical protein LMG28140_03845 [Paraburkholderia metrosideri]|uniref:Uncharacterized protein n=1 Tax=Paraburkholderia metrosideri TaxID=580937 RepID=A0ABN7I2B8_9BURK|nr:hypothetical protein LMG28140_03845 [Paraburkholderia metrosideri]